MRDPKRLKNLREWLTKAKAQAFFVPRGDEFFGEYVPPGDERLAWISGFTGSAGHAIVTLNSAYLFVDGRYTVQAKAQAPEFSVRDLSPSAVDEFVGHEFKLTSLSYDARLMSVAELERWKRRTTMVAVTKNPIDGLWLDRPKAAPRQAYDYPVLYAGETREEKLAALRKRMREDGEGARFIGDPETVCWLLNLRGRDLAYTPTLSATALIGDDFATIFCDPLKIDDELRKKTGLNVLPLEDAGKTLEELKRPVHADPKSTQASLTDFKVSFVWKKSPCDLPRALKNPTQRQGTRDCHVRDGLAFLKFWRWLETQENATEITAQNYLGELRANQELFESESFPVISAFGAHGAIVHYRSTEETDVAIKNGIYLCDSGGNYLDGTTDITRTLALGSDPTEKQKRHYTLVLKGHIALASINFPKGTAGSRLDVLARRHLWNEGLDYAHGTGHGVGSFLGVHEWPQSAFGRQNDVVLEPGMVVSNEPGFYLENEYGIRIENLQMVVESPTKGFYAFETLTLVPYDSRLIDFGLLDAFELDWSRKYHATVWEKLSPRLDLEHKAWLRRKLTLDERTPSFRE